jgi:23S rRNA (cytosine1962-C5)-methyltransferase
MTHETPTARIALQRNRDRRILSGHLWIYAGEIGEVKGAPEAGDIVDVYTDQGRFYGRGLFNPHSKIRIRLLTFENEPIDETFWAKRLRSAEELRGRAVSGTNAYRLIHGEGDLLPGLIVDRYANLLVMQTLSFGMDRRKDLLADLLGQHIKPDAIYLRNDAKSRALEGLPVSQGFLRGQCPTQVEIHEGLARFEVDVEHGQKTGWFCDQRENRLAVACVAKAADVLEVFCHTGAFGIHTALHGAKSVLGIDVSPDALNMARRHADANQVGAICRYREADAFEDLRALGRAGHRYDVVILDPPAFARSKQAVPHALAGYKEINLQALRLVRSEGFLATCSCSYHVSEQELWNTILDAAQDAKRHLKLVESRSQARDHPMLAAMPETRYLKCFVFQVF